MCVCVAFGEWISWLCGDFLQKVQYAICIVLLFLIFVFVMDASNRIQSVFRWCLPRFYVNIFVDFTRHTVQRESLREQFVCGTFYQWPAIMVHHNY